MTASGAGLWPVRTLLVDLDGTLLGSHDRRVRLEFVARTLWGTRRYGGLRAAARSLHAVRRALEQPGPEERRLLNAERAARAFGREAGLSAEEAERVLREEVGRVFPRLERHFFPVAGARRFIEWARGRYRLILATNPVWPLAQVELRLRWAGLEPGMFASITHSGRMHACKPSLDYYTELLEQEGLAASECALVGNDLRKDLPAVAAGISVFILEQDGRITAEALARVSPLGSAKAASGGFGDFARLLAGAQGVVS